MNSKKHRSWHFRLGWISTIILFGVFISGMVTTLTQADDTPEQIGDSVMHFILVLGFCGVGLLYRKAPFIHKRLIVFGSSILTSAAVARIEVFDFAVGPTYYTFYFLMFSSIIGILIYDLIVYRKIYKVNVIGCTISYVALIHTHFIWKTATWKNVLEALSAI